MTSFEACVSSLRAWISSSRGASSSLEAPKQEVPFKGGACPTNFDPIFEGDDPVEFVEMSPAELEDFLSRKDLRSFVKAWKHRNGNLVKAAYVMWATAYNDNISKALKNETVHNM